MAGQSQAVPQEVEELLTAVAAEAQPQIEAAHRIEAGTPAGMALPGLGGPVRGIPHAFTLPAFGGPVRGMALEILRMAAAAAGQSLGDYVRDHREELLGRLPRVLVTLGSAILAQVGPSAMPPKDT